MRDWKVKDFLKRKVGLWGGKEEEEKGQGFDMNFPCDRISTLCKSWEIYRANQK